MSASIEETSGGEPPSNDPSLGAAAGFAEDAARHPGMSGFQLIRYGREALTARVAMCELARKTIDLQYYIWEADATGRILTDRVMRAADRGVRVRVLLDDINLSGRDGVVASIDAHPKVEVRIFNPFHSRKARAFDYLINTERMNHRMHNKLMVADRMVAIIGGRNIGDHYFEVDRDSNFRDLDIAAIGPVAQEATAVFERYWSGDWSVPIGELVERTYTAADLERGLQRLRERIATDSYPHPLDEDAAAAIHSLNAFRKSLIWAPGQVIWDDPTSIEADQEYGRITETLYRRLDRLDSELLVESAYFVPNEPAIAKLRELVREGKRVRILTNSLASNDALAAHAGYAKRRVEVLATGAEIHEFRPDPDEIRHRVVSMKSQAGLHTKAIVFDRREVFIGSFNLDPRSSTINAEAGLYVESEELAGQVIAYLDEGADPVNSYRVTAGPQGKPIWTTTLRDGTEVRYRKDPKSHRWQRFLSKVIGWLPVEDQL